MKMIAIPLQDRICDHPTERTAPEDLANPAHDLDRDDNQLVQMVHEQTRLHRSSVRRRSRTIARFLFDPKTISESTRLFEPSHEDGIIALPEPSLPKRHFSKVLAERRSTRRPQLNQPISMNQLSAILHMAVRVNRVTVAQRAENAFYRLRPYPSPGGLYGGEIYVLPAAVPGLEDRPYRYDATRHALVDYGAACATFQHVETAEAAAAPALALIITSVYERITAKYGLRGFRLAMIEAGHIGQNITLAATASNLPSLLYSSFYDSELETMLGIDGITEVALSSVLIGGSGER